MIRPLGLLAIVGVLACTGCNKDFEDGVVVGQLNGQTIKLEGEQVVLSESQVECGVQQELWEAPVPSGDRRVARLLQPARDLKFFDDVLVEKTGFGAAQIRGDITLDVAPPFQIKDAENGVKMVTGKVGAVIKHACFASSLPLMGVRKGEFSADAPVQLRFVQEGNDWKFDRLVH